MTAQNIASEMTHAEITPEHLLVALAEQENGIVPSILRKMTLDPAQVAAEARKLFDSMPEGAWRRRAALAAHEPDRPVGPGRSHAPAG